MNRKGHVGMALLAFAPLAYILIADGKLALAVLCWLGIHTIEPLPDSDFHVPGLTHRGVSHSLLAVLVVGGVLGAGGWVLGDRLFELVYWLFSAGGGVWDWLLGRLPDLSTAILTALVPTIPPREIVSTIQQQAGGSVDRRAFALFGSFVGTFGVLAHLVGDVITVRGIKPFLPVSNWRLSLSSCRADNPVANSGFFALGVVAIVVVVGATVPGAVLGAGTPADLSPIGTVGAQDTTSGSQNGSVQINETRTNRTQVVLENVTLPQNGYIVARGGNVSPNNSSSRQGRVLGHSRYVRHGTFSDVVLTLSKPVNTSQTVSVTLHNDTNGNRTWDGTKTDAPYRSSGGTPIHDTTQVGAATSANHTRASVTLDTTNNTTAKRIVVSKARLPKGGYVAIHGGAYDEGGILYGSGITVSQYLSPGVHRNITIPVKRGVPGSQNVSHLNATTENLTAIAYRETNSNHHFEFETSYGENDGYYQLSDGDPVSDTEQVVFQKNVHIAHQRSQPASAALAFNSQQVRRVNGSPTVTIERVTLQNGGFVGIHDANYLPPTRDPLKSTIGHSRYLTSGTHRNVTVRLNTPVNRTQTLVAVPYIDTNHNHRFDYIQSGGERDIAYIAQRNDSTVIVNQTATVHPHPSSQSSSAHTTSSAQTPGFSPSTARTPVTNSSENATGRVAGEQGSFFDAHPLLSLFGGGVVVVVALTVIGRLTQGR